MASYGDLIEGLTILSKYMPKGLKTHLGGAEHDIIYAGPDEDNVEFYKNGSLVLGTTIVCNEDAERLLQLGWHVSSECYCWARFC